MSCPPERVARILVIPPAGRVCAHASFDCCAPATLCGTRAPPPLDNLAHSKDEDDRAAATVLLACWWFPAGVAASAGPDSVPYAMSEHKAPVILHETVRVTVSRCTGYLAAPQFLSLRQLQVPEVCALPVGELDTLPPAQTREEYGHSCSNYRSLLPHRPT